MIKIYRAIKTDVLRQGFGVANTSPLVLPIYQSMGMLGHDGWDWQLKCKDNCVQLGGQCEPIYCDLADGATITYIQKDVKNGFGVIALDKDGDKHLWWHLDSINPDLCVGDRVESGDLLGIGGNTGVSTGAHLHRGYYRYNEDYNNGYHGATDMTPYFADIFIKDLITNLESQVGILQKIINLFLSIFKK